MKRNVLKSMMQTVSATKLVAVCAVLVAATASFNANAGGRVGWSVTVGSSYPAPVQVYEPVAYPPPVVYPAPPVVYPAPPVVYSPPPRVVYQPPQVIYPAPVVYGYPGYYGPPRHRHGHHHGHGHGYGHYRDYRDGGGHGYRY